MKKLMLIVVMLAMVLGMTFAKEQGDLSTIISLLGQIKVNVTMFEKSIVDANAEKRALDDSHTANMHMIDENFKKIRELLNNYEYSQQKKILKQVTDLEAKFASVILKI